MRKIFSILKNKFLITFLFILAWVIFFDENDLFSQMELRQKLKTLETEKKYYINEIAQNKTDLLELRTNPANLEKFAREKYLMKKENEDIFVIVNPNKK